MSESRVEAQTRFIGALRWGPGIGYWRATWPLAELIVTNDEVIVRPRGIVRFLCPPGARYSFARLSLAEIGAYGIRFRSADDPRDIAFATWDIGEIARLLADQGIEVHDRRGRARAERKP